MRPYPSPPVADTRATFFASASPSPTSSDDVIRHMRTSLTEALRLPSTRRWVSDWLFAPSDTPFHPGLTLPPEAFTTSLAVRIAHDGPAPSRAIEPELRLAAQLYGIRPPASFPPTRAARNDAYLLLVPVACLDGVVVGYSFGRGANARRLDGARDRLDQFVGRLGAAASFPSFVGRFVFDLEIHDMLVVSTDLSDKLCGMVSVTNTSEHGRSRRLIAVPQDSYGFHHLPSRPVFMMSNEETRIPADLRFEFGREDATAGDKPHDLDHLFLNEGPNVTIPSPDGMSLRDGSDDVLTPDEITGSVSQITSGPRPARSADLQQPSMDCERRSGLLGRQGRQAPHDAAHDINLSTLLEHGPQSLQIGHALEAGRLQDDLIGSLPCAGGLDQLLAQFVQGDNVRDRWPPTVDDGPTEGFGAQFGNHPDTDWLQRGQSEVEGGAEVPSVLSESPSTSHDVSVRPGANHVPWVVSSTGAMSDGVCLSRRGGQGSSSSGAFNVSTLRQSLATLERSLKGNFYGKHAQRNFVHPKSGQVIARFIGELGAKLDGPEPAVRDMLQETAMHSYYASVLPVDPDTKLLTGAKLVCERREVVVEGGKMTGVAGSLLIDNARDAEAMRAERRRIRREKNRLSAARSNEKRRERWEAQNRELAELRQRLELLRGRKAMAEEENAALKQSLMRQGWLIATNEGM